MGNPYFYVVVLSILILHYNMYYFVQNNTYHISRYKNNETMKLQSNIDYKTQQGIVILQRFIYERLAEYLLFNKNVEKDAETWTYFE